MTTGEAAIRALEAITEFCRSELGSPSGLDPMEAAYDRGIDDTCERVLDIIRKTVT